jgi:hypothetical protein
MELKFALTESQIQSARARLLTLGIPLTEDRGTLTAKGITAEYEYHSGPGTLIVRVTKKPTLITEALVRVKLEEWLGKRAEQ